MASGRVIWVDDDLSIYEYFRKALAEVYDIDVVRNPDLFWQRMATCRAKYRGIILDVLLPYGTKISAENANGGLRTGLALLEQIKAAIEYRPIPVVIFTIRNNRDVDEFAKSYNIPVLRKQETDLDQFVETIIKEFGND